MTRSWVAVVWCTAAAADRLHGGNPGFSGGPVLDERTGLVSAWSARSPAPDQLDRGQATATSHPLSSAPPAFRLGGGARTTGS